MGELMADEPVSLQQPTAIWVVNICLRALNPDTTMGENMTLANVAFAAFRPSNALALGDEVVIEITGYAHPCENIAAPFAADDFKRVPQKLHPGDSRLYARVWQDGEVRIGLPDIFCKCSAFSYRTSACRSSNSGVAASRDAATPVLRVRMPRDAV